MEENKFGVVIMFPTRAHINTDVYKMLLGGGFEKCGAMGWNHWRNEENTHASRSKANQIIAEFNAHKPQKKRRLYPTRSKA